MITLKNVYYLAKRNEVYYDSPVFCKKGKYRELKKDVCFILSNNYILLIKKGFIWDESSVPYIFQWLFPKSGVYAIPALIHDALYYSNKFNQKFADDEMKKWMIALKINSFQIKVRHLSVKLFGWYWWNKSKNNPSKHGLINKKLIFISKFVKKYLYENQENKIYGF